MIINTIQNNFSAGELSPDVWARIDRPFYKNGLEICRNLIPLLTGGCRFRPGSLYSTHTKLNRDALGLPYRFNVEQAYSLEFTDYKVRVHTQGGVILETALTVTGITKADPGVVTCTGHGLDDGDEVYVSGVVGMVEVNQQFFLIKYINANSFSLTDIDGNDIDTSDFTAYSSGGSVARVYEIDSPYLASEAPQIKYCGTADLMYLFHPDHEPRVLIRAGNTSWSIAAYTRYSAEWAIDAITQANPGVITTTGDHTIQTGDRIYISQIEGMTELNDTEFLAVRTGAKTLTLKNLAGTAIDTSSYLTYSDKGKIAKVRDAAKTISGVTRAAAGVVTCTGHGYSTNDKIYVDGVVGMTELNGSFYWVEKIDANSFYLTDELGTRLATTSYTAYTSGGSAYLIHGLFTKIGDFPSAGGLYGGRMAIGGTDNDPDGMWMSMGPDPQTGASRYDDFSIGTTDVDALVFILASQNLQAHRVYWFSGTPNFMLVGTSSGVFKANGGSDGAPITPTAIAVSPISNVGAANIMPILVGNVTYYVEQGGLSVRGFGYSLIDDSYKAFDKNIISDEITTGGIIQLAYAKGRPELILAVRGDGVLLSCTILETEEIAGWARHILEDAAVISVVTEPQASNFDRIGLFVERIIDGSTRRYIEYLAEDPQIPDFSDYFTGEDNYAEDKEKFEKILFELQKQFVRLDSAVVLDTVQNIGITLSALSGSAVTLTADSALFEESDVGRYLYVKYVLGSETGAALITGYTSSTVVTVQVVQTFSSLTYASGEWYFLASRIGGLGHLEGETVGILTDGGVHSDEVVSGGYVDLDYPARYVILGKRYTGIGRTPDIEVAIPGGTAQARLRSTEQLFIKVRNTLGGKFGVAQRSLYTMTEPLYRRAGQSYYDRPPALVTGLKQIPVQDTWANEKKFVFVQDQPLPMTLLAVIPSYDIGEEE